jgi:hypothetical protein
MTMVEISETYDTCSNKTLSKTVLDKEMEASSPLGQRDD